MTGILIIGLLIGAVLLAGVFIDNLPNMLRDFGALAFSIADGLEAFAAEIRKSYTAYRNAGVR